MTRLAPETAHVLVTRWFDREATQLALALQYNVSKSTVARLITKAKDDPAIARPNTCRRGHTLNEANVYISPNLAKYCRACSLIANRARYARDPQRYLKYRQKGHVAAIDQLNTESA